MATIYEIGALLPVGLYLDQYNKRSHLTFLLEGVHGVGKSTSSEIAANIANHAYYEQLSAESGSTNGNFKEQFNDTIDGSILKEGEITGFPYLTELTRQFSGEKYKSLVFALHDKLSHLNTLQEYYYSLAKDIGFNLSGNRTLIIDENDNEIIVNQDGSKVIVRPMNQKIRSSLGEYNKYQFGEYLAPEDRIYLMKTGQIRGYFLLIDELNRADRYVFTELMNLALNRTINGYKLPWWCLVMAAQNPASKTDAYAVTELDNAQKDRFCVVRLDADINEWSEWAINEGLDELYIQALATLGMNAFSPAQLDAAFSNTVTPSPRSHEIACRALMHIDEVCKNFPIFSGDNGAKLKNTILRYIGVGLVGDSAWDSIMIARKDGKNLVTVKELLTGDSKDVPSDALKKLQQQSSLAQAALTNSLIKWLCDNWLQIFSYKNSTDSKLKTKYICYESQLIQVLKNMLADSRMILTNKVTTERLQCIDQNGARVEKTLFVYMPFLTDIVFDEYASVKNAYNKAPKKK